MENTNKKTEYRRLNYNKIKFSDEVKTYDEALKEVETFPWTKEVLTGERKIMIEKGGF